MDAIYVCFTPESRHSGGSRKTSAYDPKQTSLAFGVRECLTNLMGFTRNGSYVVTGVTQVPLLPGFLVLVLVGGAMMAAWYREGR